MSCSNLLLLLFLFVFSFFHPRVYFISLLFIVHSLPFFSHKQGMLKEQCIGKMNLSCSSHSVLVVKQARFGRMKNSECAKGEDIGCWADVLSILTTICSGKKKCEADSGGSVDMVKLKKKRTEGNQKCTNTQLKDNLEVVYECQQVVLLSKSASCVIVDKEEGNISSHHSRLSGCGYNKNPIVIQPPSGNYEITLKLIYFGSRKDSHLGYIKNSKSGEIVPIQDSSSMILEKVKSRIEISFDESVLKGNLKDVNFLVSFQGYSIKIFPLESNKKQLLSKFTLFAC